MTTPTETLRKFAQAWRKAKTPGAQWSYWALRCVYKPLQFSMDARFRSLCYLRFLRAREVHQISNLTQYNRYPEIFNACKSLLTACKHPRILSFGCSTGEEISTLRDYFPSADLTGVDINPWNLKQCFKRLQQHHCSDTHMRFGPSEPAFLASQAPFDAIFCMAVLQRTANRDLATQESSNIYPFASFDRQLQELDRYLAVGGILVIASSDYRFSDARIASRYEAIDGAHGAWQNRPIYSKDNQKIRTRHYSEAVFRKCASL